VSPRFTLGLRLHRAWKLLGDERSLLYWPLYRQGVLRNGPQVFFDGWRTEIEAVVDGFWWGLWVLALAGAGLALRHRRGALCLWPTVLALCAVYVLYFAESRYHLGLAMLLFPSAGGAPGELRRNNPELRASTMAFAAALPAVAIAGFVLCTSFAPELIATHRWAVSACELEGKPAFCKWQRIDADAPSGTSPVHGSLNGVGVDADRGIMPGARAQLTLQPGRYRLRGTLAGVPKGQPPSPASGTIRLVLRPSGVGQTLEVSSLNTPQPVELNFEVLEASESLEITLQFQEDARARAPAMRIWFDDLSIGLR